MLCSSFPPPPATSSKAPATSLLSQPMALDSGRANTGRLSGPRTSTFNWEGLGPVVAVLVAVHLAALLFWIVSLIKSSLAGKPKKAADKQH